MSKDITKQYWKGARGPEGDGGAPASSGHDLSQWMEEAPGNIDRRNFLKAAGFTLAGAATLAGCGKAPLRNAFPHQDQPEGIVPGRANLDPSVARLRRAHDRNGCPKSHHEDGQ